MRNQGVMERFTAQMDDTLKASKLVKAYNAEQYEVKRMEGIIGNLYALARKINRVSLIASPFTEAISAIGIAGVVWYGGTQVHAGNATPGDFFAFFTAMAMAYKPLKALAKVNTTLQLGLAGAKRVFMMMDNKPKIMNKPNAIKLENVKGDIKFQNIHFSYIKDRAALHNMNLQIDAGKKIALVGQSGGGKSTIMSMLLRFYDPEQGSITLDGHDLKDIDIHSLRDSTAYVGQEIQLFDDTITENIRYCKVEATDAEVIEAAKLANAHEFITESENGYETVIGQNGLRLSGGQRQRLSIARAILKNSPILLLDEATSALDPVSEKLIEQALVKLMKNRTTVIIAHRLSTVINADKICVITKGKLVEEGTHKQLIAKKGVYEDFYKKQFELQE